MGIIAQFLTKNDRQYIAGHYYVAQNDLKSLDQLNLKNIVIIDELYDYSLKLGREEILLYLYERRKQGIFQVKIRDRHESD